MRARAWLISVAIGLLLMFGIQTPAQAAQFTVGGWSCRQPVIISEGTTWIYPWECWYNPTDVVSQSGYGTTSYDAEAQRYACRYLRLHRPPNCANDMEMPTAGDYGALVAYQNGSGLAKLISLSRGSLTQPGINAQIDAALATHTAAIATRSFQTAEINRSLIDTVKGICEEQASRALPGAYGTLYCFDSLDRLAAENGDETFLSFLQNWIVVNHADIGIDRLSLSGLISALSPDNSLTAKYNLVTADATCADWWDMAEADGCVM